MRDFTGVDGAVGATAVEGTRWPPEMANAIVNELVDLITHEDGGDAALNPADNTQVRTAIAAMISAALSTSSLRKKGRHIGTLIANAIVYVPFAEPFPVGTNYVVSLTALNISGSNARDTWVQRGGSSEAGFYAVIQGAYTGSDQSIDGFDWVAESVT